VRGALVAGVSVDVPEELLELLARSGLPGLDHAERVRVALGIELFALERVTLGRAAELAGYRLVDFQELLRELRIPVVIYDREEYERDQPAVDRLRDRLNLDSSR